MSSFTPSAILLASPLVRRGWQPGGREAALLAGKAKTKGPSRSPARPVRSPDREASRLRRRGLGGRSRLLPDDLCKAFTEAQRAVLSVIAEVVDRTGFCDWPVEKIAAIAGVCRRTVHAALRAAEDARLVAVQERRRRFAPSLPNIIRITCERWRSWLRPAARHATAVLLEWIGCKPLHTTYSHQGNKRALVFDDPSSKGSGTKKGQRHRRFDRSSAHAPGQLRRAGP